MCVRVPLSTLVAMGSESRKDLCLFPLERRLFLLLSSWAVSRRGDLWGGRSTSEEDRGGWCESGEGTARRFLSAAVSLELMTLSR